MAEPQHHPKLGYIATNEIATVLQRDHDLWEAPWRCKNRRRQELITTECCIRRPIRTPIIGLHGGRQVKLSTVPLMPSSTCNILRSASTLDGIGDAP
jgi:hypothetical protein